MSKNKYFENVNIDTIPTQPGEEDVTPNDLISDAVQEIVDNLGGEPKKDVDKDK
jgi:hypothetical protein